ELSTRIFSLEIPSPRRSLYLGLSRGSPSRLRVFGIPVKRTRGAHPSSIKAPPAAVRAFQPPPRTTSKSAPCRGASGLRARKSPAFEPSIKPRDKRSNRLNHPIPLKPTTSRPHLTTAILKPSSNSLSSGSRHPFRVRKNPTGSSTPPPPSGD